MSSIMKKISRYLRERSAKKGLTTIVDDFTLPEADKEFVIKHLKKFYNKFLFYSIANKCDMITVGLLPEIDGDNKIIAVYNLILNDPYSFNMNLNIVYNSNQTTKELEEIIGDKKVNTFLNEGELSKSIRGIRIKRFGVLEDYDYHFIEIKPTNGKYELTNVVSDDLAIQSPYKQKWNEITKFIKQTYDVPLL